MTLRSVTDRNILIEKHLDLAKNLAKKRYQKVNNTVQCEELESAAYEGLIDAATKFDPNRIHPLAKKPFEAYASRRIIGQMTDYLRVCNWGTRSHPQHVVSLENKAYANTNQNVIMTLSETLTSKETNAVDSLNGPELFEKLIKGLSERDREVFRMRYIENLNMYDIGQLLDLSESRVSQILSTNKRYLINVWNQRLSELWDEVLPVE